MTVNASESMRFGKIAVLFTKEPSGAKFPLRKVTVP